MKSPFASPWVAAAFICSTGSLACFCVNLLWYREPRPAPSATGPVSVLIPARNEEAGIEAAIESVLAQKGVALELLVMDDHSADRTAKLAQAVAARDGRLRVHGAPSLPQGWNGKQHACAALARLARHDVLCFLDADVRLSPDALGRLLGELDRQGLDLLSGFPREETGSWLEKLLIPLIHFVLLCYLPLPFSRRFRRIPSLAAGCGQVILVRRKAYEASGGHGAIRESMHDGLMLPRRLRRKGFTTDICDLTGVASCRMYRDAGEVWRGLGKNATEGMAAPWRILPFTALLFAGQMLPVGLLAKGLLRGGPVLWPAVSVAAGYGLRSLAARRFRQSVFGALLHPLGIAVLIALQWWSLLGKLSGRQAVWKHRTYELG